MLRILAWKLLLSKNGVINSILTGFGLSRINIINTPTAVVLGMVYDFLPFMLLPIYNSMTRIRKDWIEAARDLGAGNAAIFFKIILPLTVSGIISGIVMVFVPSLTSFAISQVLGGGHVLLIGNVIEQDFMQGMQWNAGSGLSFVLTLSAPGLMPQSCTGTPPAHRRSAARQDIYASIIGRKQGKRKIGGSLWVAHKFHSDTDLFPAHRGPF